MIVALQLLDRVSQEKSVEEERHKNVFITGVVLRAGEFENSNPMMNSEGVARRHHNATILPDGTVLVTGGTSGQRDLLWHFSMT
jgi:hypothetical protein